MFKIPEFIEDADYPQKIKEIRNELEKIRETETVASFDGYKIHCESYRTALKNNKAVIAREIKKKTSSMARAP